MSFEHLNVEQDGSVVTMVFDHGKANEMGSGPLRELERLPTWLADRGARSLITTSRRRTSKGTPVFVAGADVTERMGWSPQQVKEHVRWQRVVLIALRRAPVFHIAVVGGVALGWGTEYLLTADYRIACDGSRFGLPETGLGILPGAGGTSELWAQIGMPQALRLGMTGEQIDGDEAVRIGLCQERSGTIEEGLERARVLAGRAASRSPTANVAFKQGVLKSVGQPPALRAELEARRYEHCVDTGEAARGRENFAKIRAGESVDWPDRVAFEDD